MRAARRGLGPSACIALASAFVLLTGGAAQAQQAPVALGAADSFAVLAGQQIGNVGLTVITGDLGVSPGAAIAGFPPGTVNGATHPGDAAALQAQASLTTAYNDAAGRTPGPALGPDLGGLTLAPGVYTRAGALALTGTLTLDGQGDPNAVFIIQVSGTLNTGNNQGVVRLVNGAQACRVYWQVGSSAQLGTNSTFAGTLMALTNITLTSGASVDGRTLARNGNVFMDANRVTRRPCATAAATPPASAPPPTSGSRVTTPAITGLALTPSVFRAANFGGPTSARARKKKPKARVGTNVSLRLSEAGSLKFSVERKTTGRRSGRKCAARKKANAKKKKCTRWVKVKGSFTVAGKAARNKFAFSGRIGGRALKSGSYRLNSQATGRSGTPSRISRRAFRIVR